MPTRARVALLAASRKRRLASSIKPELWPGQRAEMTIPMQQLPQRQQKQRGSFIRKVSKPLQLVESAFGTSVAFVRAAKRPPSEVNTALMQELQRRPDTFVLDTNLACVFKTLRLDQFSSTPHREVFLKFLLSVKLAAPPVAWKEYAAFGMPCAIPFSKLSKQDEENAGKVVESLIWLFKRSPKAKWLAMKQQHQKRVKDYKFVVQSAILYPKTTILTNDRDFGIFKVMKAEIAEILYQRHPRVRLNLESVSFVHVAEDLGLQVRSGVDFRKVGNVFVPVRRDSGVSEIKSEDRKKGRGQVRLTHMPFASSSQFKTC